MLSLGIQNEKVYFEDIKPCHLSRILEWYNKVDDYKFATGISSPITIDELSRKYAEVSIASNEFFVGIYVKENNSMIGILKGNICKDKKDSLWIYSIVLDTSYQNRGFGKSSIELLLCHMLKTYDIKSAFISVIEENEKGYGFWKGLGFGEVKRVTTQMILDGKRQKVIIMSRAL